MAQDQQIIIPGGVTMAWDVYENVETTQTDIYMVKVGESKEGLEPFMTTEAGVNQANIFFAEPGIYTLGFQAFEIIEDYRNESRIVWTDVDAEAMKDGETMIFLRVAPVNPPTGIEVVQ
jgi:hypothetical protein